MRGWRSVLLFRIVAWLASIGAAACGSGFAYGGPNWDIKAIRAQGEQFFIESFSTGDPKRARVEEALKRDAFKLRLSDLSDQEISSLCDFRELLKRGGKGITSCPLATGKMLGPESEIGLPRVGESSRGVLVKIEQALPVLLEKEPTKEATIRREMKGEEQSHEPQEPKAFQKTAFPNAPQAVPPKAFKKTAFPHAPQAAPPPGAVPPVVTMKNAASENLSAAATPKTFWNVWTEQTESISRTYAKSSPLQPDTTYLFAVDLAAIAYKAVLHQETGSSFGKEVEKWLAPNFTPKPIKLLLLLDPQFFVVTETKAIVGDNASDSKVSEMKIDAKKMRDLRSKGWPTDIPQAFSERATFATNGSPAPEWVFGETTYQIKTRVGVSGPTTIGISIWSQDRPVDEITYSTCVRPKGANQECEDALKTTSLTGIDSLKVLASNGGVPDAAVHFVELGEKVKGIFRVKDWPRDRFEDWTLSIDPKRFRKQLAATYLKPLGAASSEGTLGSLGVQFFDFLFPEEDTEGKKNSARNEFQKFVETNSKGNQYPDDAKSIFIRMIQQGNNPPLLIPLGLLALETKDSGKAKIKFLGSYFRIEAPLEFQDYQHPKLCIARWVTVLPPGDTGDATLDAAKKDVEAKLAKWSKKEEAFLFMKTFAEWNKSMETTQQQSSGAALVVLSHHDEDKLYFYALSSPKDAPLTPSAVKRELQQPSVAILNGCGTAGPKGSAMLRQFNKNGFMTIIATSTEVNGHMAGAFLKFLTSELEGVEKGKHITVSRAYFRALKKLSMDSPPPDPRKPGAGIGGVPSYGARALQFSLLGNGGLTLCSQNIGGPS
jgi:hypothetical protein